MAPRTRKPVPSSSSPSSSLPSAPKPNSSPSPSLSLAPVPAYAETETKAATTSARPDPSSSTSATAAGGLKQRRALGSDSTSSGKNKEVVKKGSKGEERTSADVAEMAWTERNQWMVYAVASGACAAFNGVFAKLTTNDLTGTIARGISSGLGIHGGDKVLELTVRCTFFALNLIFNGVMWTLFTQALSKGHSTTQVSIMNTSTNFMITALLGFAIFSEALPPLWWVGATLLVAGNVIIGRKDEKSAEHVGGDGDGDGGGEDADVAESGRVGVLVPELKDDDDVDEDVPLLGDFDEPRRGR
ncbi:hypothetical protein F4808DRAFT_293765 [Astrocystis sublimbata]|nr:hypothetical protein F4808DRAFT_293765 [Astrocystis sublimbata]